ncbi:conserved hypothetical protein [Thermotomaculum hydrothermale]|uniref:J domain-containing protein n=1 Tax=Thermotomaculum hydrothermale TaxID=981385 RepID=A0A7R6PDP8_9BACT|nr:J domain-containing protein [Thermotomaculum hydrothermale]BBB31848.1 conserved hypothetical protein [Thermotomaculum hydrothermale]
MNYYEILGVSRNASIDEITAAFKKKVRDLHPDRFNTEEEKREAEKQFKEVTRAFNVLKDPEKRREYDRQLQDSFLKGEKKTVYSSVNSDELFKKGLVLYKKGEYENAETFFQGAIGRGMATADAYYHLALAQMHLPRRSKKVVENLENAISLDPLNVKFRIALADFYLQKGVKSKAIHHYKRALKLDPKNKRAIEVLRSFGIIKEKNFLEKLFGNLFKRG